MRLFDASGFDGADVVADRQRQVADLGRLPGSQHGRRGDRRATDDDAVLRAEVGDRDDVGDGDAGVAAGGLLVLDDDVVVGVATQAVVAVAQRVLGLGAADGEVTTSVAPNASGVAEKTALTESTSVKRSPERTSMSATRSSRRGV